MNTKKVEQKRAMKKFVRNSLIFLIAFEVVLGGIIDVTSKNAEIDVSEVTVMKPEDLREDLDIVLTTPIIITGPASPEEGTDEEAETTTEQSTETVTESRTEVVATEPEAESDSSEETIKLEQIDSNSDTAERIHAAFNFLVSEGFSDEAAAGVIGNMAVESNFSPFAKNSLGFYGLFQWNTNENGEYWWYTICDWMEDNGYGCYTFEGQMKAMLYCQRRGLLNDDRLEELKALTDVNQAAELFAVYYEGCVGGHDYTEYYRLGNCYQDLNMRKSEAQIAYQMYITDSYVYTGLRAYSID